MSTHEKVVVERENEGQRIDVYLASKWEERVESTKNFISRFIPKITYSLDAQNEFSLGLDWKEVKKNPNEILDVAEKIAVANKCKLVICVDEFQNIASFENPLAFQKKLRSHWQRHKKVSYCLYGNKRHMMLEVFTSSSMPFYKFGHLLFLQKISLKDWIPFIVKRFGDTGKKISSAHAEQIAQLVEMHPYYVQQLAQQVWLRTKKECNAPLIKFAFDNLLTQLSFLFQSITDQLSPKQINFLRAVIDEVEQLSAKETIQDYNLGTSANVLRIKQALINKEIIDIEGNKINFLDPMYKCWLKKYYFTFQI